MFYLSSPITVLRNLRTHIKEDGLLLAVLPKGGNRPFFEASAKTFTDFGIRAPWMGSKTPSDAPTMRTLEGIRTIVESAGWDISYFKEIRTDHVFINREQLQHWLIGTLTANWNIPLEMAPQFFDRVIDYMVEIHPEMVDEQGCYLYPLSRVHVVATPSDNLRAHVDTASVD